LACGDPLYPVEILRRFKAADPDNEGTIDAKELKAAAGRSITRLLKRPLALSWAQFRLFSADANEVR
jgi:hypothetical protein